MRRIIMAEYLLIYGDIFKVEASDLDQATEQLYNYLDRAEVDVQIEPLDEGVVLEYENKYGKAN
jgi:hypothetical protein